MIDYFQFLDRRRPSFQTAMAGIHHGEYQEGFAVEFGCQRCAEVSRAVLRAARVDGPFAALDELLWGKHAGTQLTTGPRA
jgi:hypothetical protein